MNPPPIAEDRARLVAARAARRRDSRTGGATAPGRAFPLQYDEAGFPIRQPTRSFSERVRQLLLG